MVTEFYERALEPSGLKVTQYSLLRSLEWVQPIRMSELAKVIRIDRTTLNRTIKPLLKAELIEVNSGKDFRAKNLMLTQSGKETLRKAEELWREAQASLEDYLGAEELENLKELMKKLEGITYK